MELAGHTLKAYDRKLDELMDLISQMGQRVRALVITVKRAIHERSDEVVAAAKLDDKEINNLERELEEAATAIIALQSPMAVDLRFITSALKISGVMERAGDLAKNTIKRTVDLADFSDRETLTRLERMADCIVSMLDDALAAVRERDEGKAIAVWKRDDEVDALYHEVFALVQKHMQANPANVTAGTHVVFMAKNLERLADYVTNIAKAVYYIVTGEPADKSLLGKRQ
jgi:phosphate transport system protein